MSTEVTGGHLEDALDGTPSRSASSPFDQQLDHVRVSETGGALLRRVARGDEEAFARLFDVLVPTVYAIGARRSVEEQGAEQFVHRVFLALWRSAPRFLGQDLPATAWILDLLSRSIEEARID